MYVMIEICIVYYQGNFVCSMCCPTMCHSKAYINIGMIELRSMRSILSRILYVIYILPNVASFKSMYMYVMIEACIVYYLGYMIYILPCVALFKSMYVMYVMIEACIVYYQGYMRIYCHVLLYSNACTSCM